MIHSMTGYGKETATIGTKNITVEIKSLNSKQFDLTLRIPGLYKEKEVMLRSFLLKQIHRGKVELLLYYDESDDSIDVSFNTKLIKNYYYNLVSVAEEVGISNFDKTDYLNLLMRLPDIMKSKQKELDPEEWAQINTHITNCIDKFIAFRKQEGVVLEKDFVCHIDNIESNLKKIPAFEEERMKNLRSKLKQNLDDFVTDNKVDRNRFEQEIIYYLEKLDITEEKVRLQQHCNYFRETLNNTEGQGKKLGFILQEIGREINTIGSKANHADIQKLVVQMKDELEKIKEQALNVL